MRRSDRQSLSQLQQDYHALAKKADARLRALEGYSYDKYYKDIKRYAYAKAMEDIKVWSGGSARRFETNMPDETEAQRNEIKAKMVDIQRFLDMPTSTKRGVTAIYKKRADTINERYGTNFTWQQLAKYYESGMADKLSKEYGSKTALQVIGNVNKFKGSAKKVLEDIAKADKIHEYVDDEVLARRLGQAVAKFGKELILK